jgi:putative peptidoglycan lipid II flippase
MVPASVGTAALAEPIVGLLYERLEFGPQETQIVAAVLVAYAVGLVGYSAYFFMVRAFYSRQNTKTPAILNVAIFIVFVGFSYALSRLLEAPGIALALSASYAVLALASLWATRREIGQVEGRRLLVSLAKILTSGAAMYGVALLGIELLGTGSNSWDRLLILLLAGGASVAAYLGMALALRAEEIRTVTDVIKRRRRGSREETEDGI